MRAGAGRATRRTRTHEDDRKEHSKMSTLEIKDLRVSVLADDEERRSSRGSR
jgi:hypothetical protein